MTQISSDFGEGLTLDPQVTRSAAKAVAVNAVDMGEARMLLDMLGLIPAQPGFEPTTRRQTVNDDNKRRNAERRRELNAIRAEAKKAKKERGEL